uniref:Uncharacterized protein n=1 Tax=Candidatus Kentrum sp. MB TaxID=2138164 RepID=A0A450XMJ3_9GAMM|nr:MAG: hypothetical protein BECKMB1821G_GA0114241_100745 [Candidatus Kentron sp. MB]VFK30550.1 MAG: hypothetical protein BECKMB1821I_GA0114274_101627 [Candidatus Kentron sp. MB]VFK75294.1 MAG: hypothetical protein BECKMB1821H_GA0114242_101926 [Candidatus Kentron sp. MB]
MKSRLPRIACFVLCFSLIATAHATHAANHGESLVGSIPGQLTVQQGAVYTIPIEVPPGVAPGIIDTQPDLAIAPTTATAVMGYWVWVFPCRGSPLSPAAVKPSPRMNKKAAFTMTAGIASVRTVSG